MFSYLGTIIKKSVIFLGPPEGGKSSILRVLSGGKFKEDISPTLSFVEEIVGGRNVIDIAGQQLYDFLQEDFLKQEPALIVYVVDVMKSSGQNPSDFKDYLFFSQQYPHLITTKRLILAVNKIDLDKTIIFPQKASEKLQWPDHLKHFEKIESHPVIPTSAKTGTNLRKLGQYIAQYAPPIESPRIAQIIKTKKKHDPEAVQKLQEEFLE